MIPEYTSYLIPSANRAFLHPNVLLLLLLQHQVSINFGGREIGESKPQFPPIQRVGSWIYQSIPSVPPATQ